ncbi:MAG: hypothetical protein QW587_04800 [Candidatus Bathyarchaeia archaeon]
MNSMGGEMLRLKESWYDSQLNSIQTRETYGTEHELFKAFSVNSKLWRHVKRVLLSWQDEYSAAYQLWNVLRTRGFLWSPDSTRLWVLEDAASDSDLVKLKQAAGWMQPSRLVERAEEWSLPQLMWQPVPFGQGLIFNFKEFFVDGAGGLRFLLGPKGSGKTFTCLKALADAFSEGYSLSTTYIQYRLNRRFQARFGPYLSLEDKPLIDAIKEGNPIILDDIHYFCDDVLLGFRSATFLVKLLEMLIEESERGKKVVLVSEELLSWYIRRLGLKMPDLLARFGLFDTQLLEDPEMMLKHLNKIDYLAFREIAPIEYKEWKLLWNTYGISGDDEVKRIIYTCNSLPRGLIKLSNRLKPKTFITLKDLIDLTERWLRRKFFSLGPKRQLQNKKSMLELEERLHTSPFKYSPYKTPQVIAEMDSYGYRLLPDYDYDSYHTYILKDILEALIDFMREDSTPGLT